MHQTVTEGHSHADVPALCSHDQCLASFCAADRAATRLCSRRRGGRCFRRDALMSHPVAARLSLRRPDSKDTDVPVSY